MLRLRDDQWERILEHFPEEHIPDSRPGRKPVPTQAVLEAALWILNTGAQWHLLPQCYPNYKTVHRRFQQLCLSGCYPHHRAYAGSVMHMDIHQRDDLPFLHSLSEFQRLCQDGEACALYLLKLRWRNEFVDAT